MGYYVKPIVCDYGVYNDYDNELCLVCNRKSNAELIVKILQVDNGDDAEHHHDKVCRVYEPDCTRKPMERYEELERKLQSVYGECDGLLEKVVEGLVKHEGAEFEKPMKARLLTDEDVDKWDRLKGAMDRIVERLEETKGKDIVFCPPRANGKTVKLGQRIGLDRAIEIVKEEM